MNAGEPWILSHDLRGEPTRLLNGTRLKPNPGAYGLSHAGIAEFWRRADAWLARRQVAEALEAELDDLGVSR